MKIVVITLTFQERVIIPFFLRHYERFADRIVVYDGRSTDGTRELVEQHSLANLYDHDTGGVLDDEENVRIKNEAYKQEDADWYIVVDCDEFIYHAKGVRTLLEHYTRLGVTFPGVEGWDMIGEKIPFDGLLTEHIRMGVRNWRYLDKQCVFAKGVNPVYAPGAHSCAPTGNVVVSPEIDLKLLHYKYLSLEYIQRKVASLRMSENNHRNKWGYARDGRPINESWIDWYRKGLKERVQVI